MPAMRNPGPLVRRPAPIGQLSQMRPNMGAPMLGGAMLLPFLRSLFTRPSFAPRAGLTLEQLGRMLGQPHVRGALGLFPMDDWHRMQLQRVPARPKPRRLGPH